ncbi:MAG: hypothetical protein HY826_05190, partial [Actinobacteria bacterium]|nr:hypothetical protein [Actinomycetota bacterium]
MPMTWRPLGVLVLVATSLTAAPSLPSGARVWADEPAVEWVQTSDDSVVEAKTYDAVLENAPPVISSETSAGPFQSVVAGEGFNAFSLPSYGDYTIKLVASVDGDIEIYRTKLQQMANEVNAHNGLSLVVAAGQVAAPASPNSLTAPVGEIRVMVSLTSPCGALSGGKLGCGGTSSSVVVEGVTRFASGVVWLSPTLSSVCQQPVVNHEVGHALGLDHFDDLYLGLPQVMKSTTSCSFSALRAGDLNGMRWLVQPTPVNDSVASAVDVCGDSTLPASTWFATKEASEPAHAGAGPRRSVWYRYQPVTGQGGATATIATVNDGVDDFDTVLAVYRGTMFTSVVPVTSNDNFSGLLSQVSFIIDETQTYWIAVDGVGFARGETDVVFDVPPAPPPTTNSLVS